MKATVLQIGKGHLCTYNIFFYLDGISSYTNLMLPSCNEARD